MTQCSPSVPKHIWVSFTCNWGCPGAGRGESRQMPLLWHFWISGLPHLPISALLAFNTRGTNFLYQISSLWNTSHSFYSPGWTPTDTVSETAPWERGLGNVHFRIISIQMVNKARELVWVTFLRKSEEIRFGSGDHFKTTKLMCADWWHFHLERKMTLA